MNEGSKGWIGFNMNQWVRVKLTEAGLAHLKKNHEWLNDAYGGDPFGGFEPPVTDEEGYSRYQLWSLMEQLGPAIRLGANPPFETTILLDAQAMKTGTDETAQQAQPEG